MQLNSFSFSGMHLSKHLDYFEFSLALFFFSMPFPLTGSFVAHFIVFLSHEILAGFHCNQGRNLIFKE